MKDENIAIICKALGDHNRLKIVKMLSQGELCACKILEYFNFTQPTLSHHMKVLCDCQLVNARKEGKWSYYQLNSVMLSGVQNFFNNMDKELHDMKVEIPFARESVGTPVNAPVNASGNDFFE